MSYDEEKEIFRMQQNSRNRQGLNSVYVQPTTGSAIDKAKDWYDYQNTKSTARKSSTTNVATSSSSGTTSSVSTSSSSNTTSKRSSTSSSSSSTGTSATTNTSRATTSTTANTSTLSNSTTSSRNTSSSVGTTSSGSTTSSRNTTSSVGTTSSSSSAVAGTSTSVVEVAAEPSIETQAENQAVAVAEEAPAITENQAVAVAEEIPAIPEQPSGQSIYAPDEGGQLWGGEGFVADTLIGGAGQDIFIGGKEQGSDTFLNVSASDEVRLTDVTLKDISDISKDGDTIRISLDNGNVFTIQSSDTVSGAVVFGDSTWHFKHTPQA